MADNITFDMMAQCIHDAEDEYIFEHIEECLNDDPSVVIESLVWMMESME